MNKILITGLNGFVGKHLSKYLGDRNYKIYGLVREKQEKNDFTYDEINACFSQSYLAVIHLAGKAHDLKNVTNETEYFSVNLDLTKKIYEFFQNSNSRNFIYFSSVKAVADKIESTLTEEYCPNPQTAYGKSKLAAEQYLIKNQFENTNLYIIRPCMIHGKGNKGNLNLLYKLIKNRIPYPLGAFTNKRSFLNIDNLCFMINELIINANTPSGVYNVADDGYISTRRLVEIIGQTIGKHALILNLPKTFINNLALLGTELGLPFNKERLGKLTENFMVSNEKIMKAINKPLPNDIEQGIINTINSLKKD